MLKEPIARQCLSKRIWQHIFTIVLLAYCVPNANCYPDQGKWTFTISSSKESVRVPKSMFAGSEIYVTLTCDSLQSNNSIRIKWILYRLECWQSLTSSKDNRNYNSIEPDTFTSECRHDIHIPLPEYNFNETKGEAKNQQKRSNDHLVIESDGKSKPTNNRIYTVPVDGAYVFELNINSVTDKQFEATVNIEMRLGDSYLSAVDWPLLPFYGVMCLIYVLYGVIWLVVSFSQWRDLLRIQFWIGGVILLGMLEKAMFYAEYQSINSNGTSVRCAVLLAEWVSCAKRTLARMLVIIVSLGFGIVKPRLGPMLHRVVGTGAVYFVLASVESYLRVMNVKSDPNNQILVASIPLAVLDSAICWWIFTSLVQTTRTLRLRRNMVKLTLYRHFTNTLIFSVIASVVFMLFSIKTLRLTKCLTDWKIIWQDDAFWHILFSLLLLVIMILWRPTNNNQRYAFTPLLDNPEDEDDDDEEDQFVADVYGVKMRGTRNINSPKQKNHKATTTDEDDLRWVEENIPIGIADVTLPVLDSDEEIINTRFEVSKMQ